VPAFARPVPPIVVPEAIAAAREAMRRVVDREDPIHTAAPVGSRAPRVATRIRLRGIPVRGAVTIRAERGASTRFASPRRRTGGITTAGSGPVRAVRVEAAWSARGRHRGHRRRGRRATAGQPGPGLRGPVMVL